MKGLILGVLCAVVLALGVDECSSGRGAEEEIPPVAGEARDTTATAMDTLDQPRHPPPPPAPGTARAAVRFESCAAAERGYRCRVEVARVDAYGMATPVLPAGTTLTAEVAGRLVNAAGGGLEALIEAPAPVEVTLMHRNQPAMADEEASSWSIVAIR